MSEEDYIVWTRRVTPQENDIVFSYEATLGRYVLIPKGFYGCLGRRLGIVRCDKSRVNPRWLYYFFLSPEWSRFTQSHKVRGSTVDRLSVDDFPGYEIPLPPLDEQNRTVDAIFPIDQKIDLNTRLCSELEAMAKTLYDYWFVQFDFPDENGKPYRTSGGAMEWCQELAREVPKGWKVKQLNEILILLKDGTHNPPKRIKSGIPLLTGTMFGNLFLDYSQATYISSEDYRTIHSQYAPQPNDIILTKIGTLGNVNFLRSIDIPIAIHCNSALLRFPEYMSGMFSVMYCKSDEFIKRLKAAKGQSVQEFCSLERIGSVKMLVPHLETIIDYNSKVRAILAELERVSLENNELIHIRDWLLPMLMDGQVKVFN